MLLRKVSSNACLDTMSRHICTAAESLPRMAVKQNGSKRWVSGYANLRDADMRF